MDNTDMTLLLLLLVAVLLFYVCHLEQRIRNLQLELFKYASHDYVVQRFSNVWSEVHRTQDEVDRLKTKKWGKR